MKKKVISIFLAVTVLFTFATPALASETSRLADTVAAANAFVDAYVESMDMQEVIERGESTGDFAILTLADGTIWGASIYKIDTTEIFQAFSSDVPENKYSVTYVVDTTNVVPLNGGSTDSITDRFGRIRLNMTASFFRTAVNSQGYTSMRITNVRGNPTFLEDGVQITAGTVRAVSVRVGTNLTQDRSWTNVRSNFDHNTGLLTNVRSGSGSTVQAQWTTTISARGETFNLNLVIPFHTFFLI